jgi:small subunit ribosomal protein S8
MYNSALAHLCSTIQNGQRAGLPKVEIPETRLCIILTRILVKEGLIGGYRVTDEIPFKYIIFYLKYTEGGPAIETMKCVSKPGHPVYWFAEQIRKESGSSSTYMLATSFGMMTHRKAAKLGIGGTVICKIN